MNINKLMSFLFLVMMIFSNSACVFNRNSSSIAVPAQVTKNGVNISIPPPSVVDDLDLRFCPLDFPFASEIMCNSIGTTGPVQKISWNSGMKSLFGTPLLEAYVLFDKNGQYEKRCRRGHVDFQGWSCSEAKTRLEQRDDYSRRRVELDSYGRIIKSNKTLFASGGIYACAYDDSNLPHTSNCNDGYYIHKFSYDSKGRRLSYHRSRIPQPNDLPERQMELERAYSLDVKFIYFEDNRGNWVTLHMLVKGEDNIERDGLIERIITYY